MKIFKKLLPLALCFIPSLVVAGPYYDNSLSTTTGKTTLKVSGDVKIAASSATPTSYTIQLLGQNGTGQFNSTVTAGAFVGPISTMYVNLSTVTDNLNEIRAATGVLRTDTWAQFGYISESTSATNANVSALSLSSIAARADINSLSSSSVAARTDINALSISTASLEESKVSTSGASMSGNLIFVVPAKIGVGVLNPVSSIETWDGIVATTYTANINTTNPYAFNANINASTGVIGYGFSENGVQKNNIQYVGSGYVTASRQKDLELATVGGADITFWPGGSQTVAFNSNGTVTLTDGLIAIGSVSASGLKVNYGVSAATGEFSGVVSASDFKINDSILGSTTFYTLHDWMDGTQSGGIIEGGVITSNGDGTVAISAGRGLIKTEDKNSGDTRFLSWDTKAVQTLTEGDNYVYISYNGGNPVISSTTNRASINYTNQFILGKVWKEGTDADIVQAGVRIDNLVRRNEERLFLRGYERMSGAAIAETGTRYLTANAGVFYLGNTAIDTPAQNTSGADSFTYYYRDGVSGWTKKEGSKQMYNDGYDNNSGSTVTLTANRVGVYWAYICMEGNIYIVYGQGDYTPAQAEVVQPPSSLPPYITGHALLVAKILITKGSTNITSISSAWEQVFTPQLTTTHNNLGSIQGGTTNDYQHLTTAELGYVQNIPAQNAAISASTATIGVSTGTLSLTKASTGTCVSPNFPRTLNSGGVVCAQPSDVTGSAASVPESGIPHTLFSSMTLVNLKANETVIKGPSPYADIRGWGAVCDGVTNVATAVDAAIAGGAKTIFIPKNCRWLPTSDTIPGHLRIIGEDWETSIIEVSSTDTVSISIGSMTSVENVAIWDAFGESIVPSAWPANLPRPVRFFHCNIIDATCNAPIYPYESEIAVGGDGWDIPGLAVNLKGTGDAFYAGTLSNGGYGYRVQLSSSYNSGLFANFISGATNGYGVRARSETGSSPSYLFYADPQTDTPSFTSSPGVDTTQDIVFISQSKTAGEIITAYQSESAFTGTGLYLNLGNGGGSFSGNFITASSSGAVKFNVSSAGLVSAKTLDIGVTGSTLSVQTNGHVSVATTNPGTLSSGGGTSCGSGATISGSDTAGRIVFGTSPDATCSLTFRHAYASAPICVVSGEGTATGTWIESGAANTTNLYILCKDYDSTVACSGAVTYYCFGK